jgi:PAS domain-containing protein
MPARPPVGTTQNRILAGLSMPEQSRLQEDLERVALLPGQILQNAGELLTEVYFPISCVISLLATTRNGAATELAMTGNEGLAGVSLVLGSETTSHKLVVQSAGEAYRLKAEIMGWELADGGRLQQLALRHAEALMVQIAQGYVCARHHTIEMQLCRWLLLCLDRLPARRISMTHDRIASLLGVRREAVSYAAGKLQAAGLISYSRGVVDVTDRAGLEQRVCECYATVRQAYDRLFQANSEIEAPSSFRPNPATLRQRAEARWREQPPAPPQTPWDAAQLQHELEVRMIELEINNEALHQAYDEADALSGRYADIYDFAPIGYFTLDAQGNILDLNLAGAILLGLKRSQKGRHRFISYLAPDCQANFAEFVAKVLRDKTSGLCEIELAATPLRPTATARIEAVPDEAGKECRMVMLDITEQRNVLLALEESEMRYRRFIGNLPLAKGIAQKQSDEEQ